MKLPRWLVVSLIGASVLAVLCAGAWWWVTWPERTAREFVQRVTTNDESWSEILRPNDDVNSPALRLIRAHPPKDVTDLAPQPRSIGDMILSRRTFKTGGEFEWEFVAQRNFVIRPSDKTAFDALEKAYTKAEADIQLRRRIKEQQTDASAPSK